MTEWVTNAFKYAYPGGHGEVRVRLRHLPDGRGGTRRGGRWRRPKEDGPLKGTGLGTRIVKAMASSMEADITYGARSPGTLAA